MFKRFVSVFYCQIFGVFSPFRFQHGVESGEISHGMLLHVFSMSPPVRHALLAAILENVEGTEGDDQDD